MRHLLHERIGEIIQKELGPKGKGFIVKLDKACAINNNKRPITNNPLFIDKPKGNDTEITNVDILCYKMNKIKLICSNSTILKIGQNLKYDIRVLKKYGVDFFSFDDTMLLSYALDNGFTRHGIDDLAYRHLNHSTIKFKDLVGSGKKKGNF